VGAALRVGWQGESPPTVTHGNSDICKCPQPNLGTVSIQKGMNAVSSMRLGLVWNIQKLGLLGEIDHYCGVLVEAGGGGKSVLPAMHRHVLWQLERPGCRLAAHWRVRESAKR